MKFLYLLLLSAFISFSSISIKAQSVELSGLVHTISPNKPLPYANLVLLRQPDSLFVTGAIGGEQGSFLISKIPIGQYWLKCSLIGYETIILAVDARAGAKLDLGILRLKESAVSLEAVKVLGDKQQFTNTLESQTFTVDRSIANSGGSGLDALKILPSVTLNAEGGISIRGSDKILILIDGRPSGISGMDRTSGLDKIPASAIESIEIINNPSSKYNADGLAGVINIHLKADRKQGLSGQATLNAGTRDKYNGLLNLNYRTQKLNLFLLGSALYWKGVNRDEVSNRYTFNSPLPNLNSRFLENRTQNANTVKGGIDFYLHRNHTLTAFVNYSREAHTDLGQLDYQYRTESLENKRDLQWLYREPERNYAFDYSLRHQWLMKKGSELNSGLIYTYAKEFEIFEFTAQDAYFMPDQLINSQRRTQLIETENTYNLFSDFARKTDAGKIEAGANIILRTIHADFALDTLNPGTGVMIPVQGLGNNSTYQQNVYAAYGTFSKAFQRWAVTVGARAELATIDYRIDPTNPLYRSGQYDYFQIYPNVKIERTLSRDQKLVLFANRRVNRPTAVQVRAYPKYDDVIFLKTGNPYLRPEFTNIIELAYQKRWSRSDFSISFYGKQRVNVLDNTFAISPDGYRINIVPQNLNGGANLGTEINLSKDVTQFLKLNGSVNVFANSLNAYSITNIYGETISSGFRTLTSWNGKLIATAKLPHQTELQISGVYIAPEITAQGKTVRRYSMDAGIEKQFDGGRGKVNLRATDLLHTLQFGQRINNQSYLLNSVYNYETRIAYLGVSYKVGK